MEELFRFMLVRPPTALDADRTIALEQDTAFQRDLRRALDADDPGSAVQTVAAEKFVGGTGQYQDSQYVASPGRLHYGERLAALDRSFARLGPADGADASAISALIEAAMGAAPGDIVLGAQFEEDRRSAADTLVAVKLLRDLQRSPAAAVARSLRFMELIRDVALGRALEGRWSLPDILERPLELPDIFPIPPPRELAIERYTHGSIQPVGVADLLMVRQELTRYQAREVAHIENVLAHELKSREHRRRSTTEETLLTETETSREEARELESTERFELQREIAETLQQDSRLEASVRVSGSYGPSVDFEAGANGAVTESKTRSAKAASTYANDVTQRSAVRVAERVREQRTRRTVELVEEINKHELDNHEAGQHVIGIYQWVEKVYEAQVFNYGVRTLYEFMVPEPAAYLIKALQRRYTTATAGAVREPAPFELRADEITEGNYHQYVVTYETTGIEPPPERYVTIPQTFSGKTESGLDGRHAEAAVLQVPPGYRAITGSATRSASRLSDDEDSWRLSVCLGHQVHTFSSQNPATWEAALAPGDEVNETVGIPVWIRTTGVGTFAVAIEIVCARTDRAMDAWKQSVHTAILQAYQNRRREYEEKLAALRAEAGVAISGRHPDINRLTERNELKKACISILTRQWFGGFDAIVEGDGVPGHPRVDVDEASREGPYIRFFEQAFEWHNIAYVLYPYYSGSAVRVDEQAGVSRRKRPALRGVPRGGCSPRDRSGQAGVRRGDRSLRERRRAVEWRGGHWHRQRAVPSDARRTARGPGGARQRGAAGRPVAGYPADRPGDRERRQCPAPVAQGRKRRVGVRLDQDGPARLVGHGLRSIDPARGRTQATEPP